MTTSEQIQQIENRVFDSYQVNSRPAGPQWVRMVLDLARRIMDAEDLAEQITPETAQELQSGNHHTASEAVKIILDLRGRA